MQGAQDAEVVRDQDPQEGGHHRQGTVAVY